MRGRADVPDNVLQSESRECSDAHRRDTNLLVSGVISAGGMPRQLLDAAKARVFELCTSEVLLAELLEVLSREKFAGRLNQAMMMPQSIVDDLRRFAMVVPRSPQAIRQFHAAEAAVNSWCDDAHIAA